MYTGQCMMHTGAKATNLHVSISGNGLSSSPAEPPAAAVPVELSGAAAAVLSGCLAAAATCCCRAFSNDGDTVSHTSLLSAGGLDVRSASSTFCSAVNAATL